MQPALDQAGLRKFRFHDLRHIFGSLLVQAGLSLAYVNEQMGHASIQVTVDTYGHLVPGENAAWINTLDSETSPATSAPQTHTRQSEKQAMIATRSKEIDSKEVIWLPPRDSNPDMLIQSQLSCR
jgi:hypothetical protein